MIVSPFMPLGEQARWRAVLEVLRETATGDVVTYESLGALLTLDPDEDRHAIQVAMRRASKEMETVDKRTTDAVKNIGYRIVEPEEQIGLARRYQRRSANALVSGQSKVVNVDLSGVDPDIRHAFHVMASAFSMQVDFNRRVDVRQSRLEDAIASIQQRTVRTDDELDRLKARLAKLERGQADDSGTPPA